MFIFQSNDIIMLLTSVVFDMFEVDNEVGKVVSNYIKGYFTEPHANISQAPKEIVDTWFHMFAVID